MTLNIKAVGLLGLNYYDKSQYPGAQKKDLKLVSSKNKLFLVEVSLVVVYLQGSEYIEFSYNFEEILSK